MAGKRRPLAIVLLSGGMDSAVAAAETRRTHRLACLHATYGQRTARRERVCFGALAHHFGAEAKLVVKLAHLGALGGSSLTDRSLPVMESEPRAGGIPDTYVPFRNAQLLSAAVAWAEVLGAERIVIGAVEEDSSGYPDCRAVFYEAFRQVIRLGTRPETGIDLATPVIGMSKAAIVRRGVELDTPFHLTWSCYREENRACGLCESCKLRLRGFAAAGVNDPIPYAAGYADETRLARRAPKETAEAARQDRRRRVQALESFLVRVRGD
jgi:7-cyano-7-deazaguanine synthase